MPKKLQLTDEERKIRKIEYRKIYNAKPENIEKRRINSLKPHVIEEKKYS